jgi:hypothetical protein
MCSTASKRLCNKFSFVKETFEAFDGICNDFRRAFDGLIRGISKKKEEVILNKGLKLNLEKKAKYKSILTFSMNAFESHFSVLRRSFEERFAPVSKELIKNLVDFQSNFATELQSKSLRLKDELGNIHQMRDELRRKKERYFDAIHIMSLDRLTKLKNQKTTDEKGSIIRI